MSQKYDLDLNVTLRLICLPRQKKKYKTKQHSEECCFLAVRTGLEPATPCVTGTYSNQLNYRTVYLLVEGTAKVMPSIKFFQIFLKIFLKPPKAAIFVTHYEAIDPYFPKHRPECRQPIFTISPYP